MIFENELIAENKISFSEFKELSLPLFKSIVFMIDKPSQKKDLIKKQRTLNTLKQLIGDVTSIGTLESKEDKIKMIDFLEKINLQIELIDLRLGKSNPSDLKIAGERLGKKAQSSF